MTWKPPAAPKCHICDKSVYHVEQVIGPGGLVYHDSCFKCSICSKHLDSTNLSEKDKKIFCKVCYGKHFGPKGYGFAGGSSFLTTGIYNDVGSLQRLPSSNSSSIGSSPKTSPNTPEITSATLTSPEVPTLNTRSLQKTDIPEPVDSSFNTQATDFSSTRSIFASPKPRRFYVEQEPCLRCKKSVYAAEQVIAFGGKFHQNCFRCTLCSKSLVSTNLTEHDRELYCKSCYSKEFGPKGYGFANGSAFLTSYGAV